MDKIFVKDILARGIIGINEWERQKPQDILINLELYFEKTSQSTVDNLDDYIDYSKVTKNVIQVAESANRFTVEALAEDIAQACLKDMRILKITVRVEKPGAVRFSKSVGVEIQRTR